MNNDEQGKKIDVPRTPISETEVESGDGIEENYLNNRIISKHIIMEGYWKSVHRIIDFKRKSKQLDELEIISALKSNVDLKRKQSDK